MTALDIADIFEEIALLLELRGENQFKVRAYNNAARLLSSLKGNFEDIIQSIENDEVKGIGPGLKENILTLVREGSLPYLEELRLKISPGILELMKVPGLGAKKVRTLHDTLGVDSLQALENACKNGQIAELRGFGQKTQDKILISLELLKEFEGHWLLSEATSLAESLCLLLLKEQIASKIAIAGDVRRSCEVIKELVLVAETPFNAKKFSELQKTEGILGFTQVAETESQFKLSSGMPVRLITAAPENFGETLLKETGSEEFLSILETEASRNKIQLPYEGSESEILARVGFGNIAPEMREDSFAVERFFELEESQKSTQLVTQAAIRGILHVHSTYSDGQLSIGDWATLVRDAGFEYLGITDHSQSAAYAGGLKPEAVKRQHDEIDKLNEKLKPFHIFKGIESDILADGKLDYTDKILSTFDFVIASVHSRFNQSKEEMMKRIVTAIENPHTTILGHPTGRLLLKRKGYEVDMPEILEAASKHNVAIEINSNPKRLDLDWRWLLQASSLGIQIPILPDAHASGEIDNIRYGVGIARKGGLLTTQVLNCKNLTQIQKHFQSRK